MKFSCFILALIWIFISDLKGEVYFPIDKNGKCGVSEFVSEWFSKHLQNMDEPPLYKMHLKHGTSCYRFLLLPTWGKPISVRITIEGEVGTLVAKRLNGQGGYEPGKLIENKTIQLQKKHVEEFKKLFDGTYFFQEITDDKYPGLDGSQWVLEAIIDGKYHLLNRWSPDYDTKKRVLENYKKLCEWIYRTSPLEGNAMHKTEIEIAR